MKLFIRLLKEFLDSKESDDERLDCISFPKIADAILRNANRLQRLTTDILDVTKIESNSLHLNKERFNLSDLISNVLDDFRNDIP